MNKKFIAKPDTWFDAGTECELLVDCRPELSIGIFKGIRTSQGVPELHSVGEKYVDEEDCSFDEFEEIDG